VYTEEEIQDAVSKLVADNIRSNYTNAGGKDVQTLFNDYQAAAAGVFVNNLNATYYVIQLACQRLIENVDAEVEVLDSLISNISNLSRRLLIQVPTSQIANAQVAAQALASSVADRDQTFIDITQTAAYKRFTQNVDAFLAAISEAIKFDGQIIPTPQESRTNIPTLMSQLLELHADVYANVTYLTNALNDYNQIALPIALASSIAQNVATDLNAQIATINTATDKTEPLKDVALSLFASKAAMSSVAAIPTFADFAVATGTITKIANTDFPAIPATIRCIHGPYPIGELTDTLEVVIDGTTNYSLKLPHAQTPTYTILVAGPYAFSSSIAGTLIVEAVTADRTVRKTVSFPSASLSPQSVISQWNLADLYLPSNQEFPFELALAPLNSTYSGIIYTDTYPYEAGKIYIYLPVQTLDVSITDNVIVTSGPEEGRFFVVNLIQTTEVGTYLIADGVSASPGYGTADITSEASLIFRIKPEQAQKAIDTRMSLRFTDVVENTVIRPITKSAAYSGPFGIPPGLEVGTQIGSIQDIVDSVNATYSGIPDVPTKIVASSDYDMLFRYKGRTEPGNSKRLILYSYRGSITKVSSDETGRTYTLKHVDGISLQDTVRVIYSDASSDIDVLGRVDSAYFDEDGDFAVLIIMDSAVQNSVYVEIVPSFQTFTYLSFRISDSTLHNGIYTLALGGQDRLGFTIEQDIYDTTDVGGIPFFFTVELVAEVLILSSASTNLESAIELRPSNALSLFATDTVKAYGSTPYLVTDTSNVEATDIVQLYDVTASSITSEHTISTIQDNVITISPALSLDRPTFALSTNIPPFARIRKGNKNSFTILKARLDTWLNTSINRDLQFLTLTRLVNVVLSNTSPSLVQVRDAVAGFTSLRTQLADVLTNALNEYEAYPISDIDALIQSFLAKGADRGVDILLQGRFSDFFQLSLNEMSYSGNVMDKLRAVASNDLSVNSTGRTAAQRTNATWEDIDYDTELDTSDIPDIELPEEFTDLPSLGS